MNLFWNERFLTPTFSSISVWSWILPILLGLFYYKLLYQELRWLLYFSIFSLAFEYFSGMPLAINVFETPTNYPYYHAVTPIFFGFHLLIFKPVIRETLPPKLISWLFAAFTLFCVWNAWWGDGLMNFNGNSLALLSVSCILIGITFFIYLLRMLTTERPERSAFFWLSVGTVIYYSGSFLLWLAVRYINFSRAEFYSIYDIHAALSIFLHLCYCGAILSAVYYRDQDLLTTSS